MKNIIAISNLSLILIVLILSTLKAQALTVISDLDDTIKITRVKRIEAISNGLFSTHAFLGMPELMRSFKHNSENKLIIISGSPQFVKGPVLRLLEANAIITDKIDLVGKTKNKLADLRSNIEKTLDDVVLLGDDQESDPDFYQELKNSFPDKIKAIYIHQLNKRILPVGQVGFLTAYEVAVHEAVAGRLNLKQVENVKESILRSLDFRIDDPFISRRISYMLIPEWQECSPRSVAQVLSSTRSLDISDQSFLSRVEKNAINNCD
jgi:hypothetical protein